MRIEWHPLARADLAGLVAFIAAENPNAAYSLHDLIRTRIDVLATHAEVGRPGRVPGTRELVIPGSPYIAAYRIGGEAVTILRVLHGGRRWPHTL